MGHSQWITQVLLLITFFINVCHLKKISTIFNSLQVKFHSAVLLMGRGTMQPADGVEMGQMVPVAAGMVRLRDGEGWKVMDGRCRTDSTAARRMARLRTYGTEGGPQMVQHEDGRWCLLAQAEDERKEKVTRWVGVEREEKWHWF